MTKIEFEELSEWAWAIRELPSSIEALYIDENLILAGDKEGNITCWNYEGELLWKQNVGNRVENFVLAQSSENANLFLVAGLDVCGLNVSTGDLVWKAELEGISDLVAIDEKNQQLIVTSSVFDIEYHDFIEGSCWRFSFDGDLLGSHKMDEKAWHLHSDKESVILGLGRPRNGILMVDNDKYEHMNLEDSPICCGYKNILGHSNGVISIFNKSKIKSEKICESAISAITMQNNSILISNQSGQLYYKNKKDTLWEYYSEDILSLVNGVTSVEFDLTFASTRTDNGSKLFLLNSKNGDLIFSSENENSIRTSSSYENMLLLGMENGKILILEMDLLLRRFNQKNDSDNIDEDRKKMLDKLRKLRK